MRLEGGYLYANIHVYHNAKIQTESKAKQNRSIVILHLVVFLSLNNVYLLCPQPARLYI